MILGVLAATALGLIFGVLEGPDGVVDAPGRRLLDDRRRSGPVQPGDALTVALIPVIFALFMTDFFDTIGTAVAVGRGGGLTDEQGPAQLRPAAAGGLRGGLLRRRDGHLERHDLRGVGRRRRRGRRTGLSSLVAAGLFGLAILFVPIIALVGQDVKVGEDTFIHPAIAPALVMVGYLMIRIVADIDWTVPENSIPAFLTIAGIPLTFSIAAGIGLGVISYVLVMAAPGRSGAIHPLMWAIAPFFVAFFAADWLSANVF